MPVPHRPILDPETIATDLREAVAYAAPAGLLQDPAVVRTLHEADVELARGDTADTQALALALSRVTAAIAPVTLADLRSGRNPHSAANQARAKRQQLFLTVLGLLLMLCIASAMLMVKAQQTALVHLDNARAVDFRSKVNALRRMAQREGTALKTGPLAEQFHERVLELKRLSSEANIGVGLASAAMAMPWEPLYQSLQQLVGGATLVAPTVAATGPITPQQAIDAVDDCEIPAGDDATLPRGRRYPDWLRSVAAENADDYCFQQHLLPSAGNDATLVGTHLALQIRQSLVTTVEWVLPFLFGLLGAAVHLMRAVGSARIAASSSLAIATRVSLGGIGGVAIGWFAEGSAGATIQTVSAISLPFVLAFIIGYGIEALFALLDRLNGMIGSIAGGAPPARPAG